MISYKYKNYSTMCFLEKLNTSSIHSDNQKQLKKEAHAIKDTQWLFENKWLVQQTFSTQMNIFEKLHKINVPLTNVNMHIIVECYYTMLKDETKTVPSLPVPKRAYSVLLTRVYEDRSVLNIGLLQKISRFVFDEIVQHSLHIPLLLHRGHLLIFFERLHCLCLQFASSSDTLSFCGCMESVAYYAKKIRQKCHGYKRKVCLKLYSALVVSLFKTLFMYSNYKALECLYKHHSSVINRNVQKMVLVASDNELDQLWSVCPTIRQFCIDNVLKWTELSEESYLWTLCNTHMDGVLVDFKNATLPHTDLVSKLQDYTNGHMTQTYQLIQRYPRHTQRRFILSLCHCVNNAAEYVSELSQDILIYAKTVLKTYIKHVFVVCNYEKTIVDFYHTALDYTSKQLFDVMFSWTHVSPKLLQLWISLFGALPISYLQPYFEKLNKRDPSRRVMPLLHGVETTMSTVLSTSTTGWASESHEMLKTLRCFLVRFEPAMKLRLLSSLQTFVRVLLMNAYLQSLPTVTNGKSDAPDKDGFTVHHSGKCCSICYEDETETDNALCQLPCQHIFHRHCLSQMAMHTPAGQKDIGRCPYCMTPLQIKNSATLSTDEDVSLCSLWLATTSQETII